MKRFLIGLAAFAIGCIIGAIILYAIILPICNLIVK